ncbi:hypothetical protein TSOC_012459 [Tetrabaena socialis]|uniref:SnoaL-like domain-containing protein n=1 Tax=Tetrabaena socialis TaxID=47790 RepID=A0A2J7ZMZ8_9CHLO|nr:hypothetical protein TSOC_012459 [Tetrabaena socialis]|eukprot:PNH01639.1 hypothetical protein TSOC_012459 [Tetrabaena socialis]
MSRMRHQAPKFIGALNNRDLSSLLQLVAQDCRHEDLSRETHASGKEEVARFYADVVASLPETVKLVVDDLTAGDDGKAGVMHMEVNGSEVPCSRGLSFFRVSLQEPPQITYVRQSPEHFIKLTNMVLSATASATPLIDTLGPMAMPSFWANLARGASSMLASVPPVEPLELLMSLAAAGAANTVPAVPGLQRGGFTGAHTPMPSGAMHAMPAVSPTHSHHSHAPHISPRAARSPGAIAVAGAVVSAATAATMAPPRAATVVCSAAVLEAPPATITVRERADGLITAPERPRISSEDEPVEEPGISGVQRATAKLIEGLELAHTQAGRQPSFNVHFLTIVPMFKVTEAYPLGGGQSKMRRRDQRGGDAKATAELIEGGVKCRSVWDAPFAGSMEESYTTPEGQPDVMHVRSTLRVGERSATTLQVYQRRRNMSAREVISASEKRNGKASDVLKRFGMPGAM